MKLRELFWVLFFWGALIVAAVCMVEIFDFTTLESFVVGSILGVPGPIIGLWVASITRP